MVVMNCRCQPPRPAVIRRVSKSGPNYDKEFFTCELGQSGCQFFQWADATMPPPAVRSFAKSTMKSSTYNEKNRGMGIRAKIAISAIQYEGKPPMKIFLYLQVPSTPALSSFLDKFPPDVCWYNHASKLWIFSLEIYDQVVRHFESEEMKASKLELDGLPRFLSHGLKNYLKRLNVLPDTTQMELNVTPALRQMLLPFQVEGIKFVIARGGRALIGDEMGTRPLYRFAPLTALSVVELCLLPCVFFSFCCVCVYRLREDDSSHLHPAALP